MLEKLLPTLFSNPMFICFYFVAVVKLETSEFCCCDVPKISGNKESYLASSTTEVRGLG